MGTIVEFKDYSMGFQDDNGKVYNLLDRLSFKVEEGKALEELFRGRFYLLTPNTSSPYRQLYTNQ